MRTVTVPLSEHTYPIYIGYHLFQDFSTLIMPYLRGKQVMIVTNETVAPLYLERVEAALPGLQVDTIILPDGEQHKTLATVSGIFDHLVTYCHRRSTSLMALGGGVIGDLTGFAAACYQRGVDFIQIPTTLLAQVDAAVGGKTAVNHPQGKNMIGAFYQPRCVVSDIACLETLPDREFHAGFAEVIKYGLICDPAFFNKLEMELDDIKAKKPTVLLDVITTCCELKVRLVIQDEKDNHVRALLNFGHTVGHAVESGVGYGAWLHGEAVALGMLVAVRLSIAMGYLDSSYLQRLQQLLVRAKLPIAPPADFSAARCKALITYDKKTLESGLRFVLLKDIGKAFVAEVDTQTLDAVLIESGFHPGL